MYRQFIRLAPSSLTSSPLLLLGGDAAPRIFQDSASLSALCYIQVHNHATQAALQCQLGWLSAK
jgi:hypothetical protein